MEGPSEAAQKDQRQADSNGADRLAKKFDLGRFPPGVRLLLEEFADCLGEDLLGVSPVRCSWPDCGYPATVLIRTREKVQGEKVGCLVWGCPKCGRQYRPKAVSAQEFDRTEGVGFGQ